MASEPMMGIRTRRQAGLPTGYTRMPRRSVSNMKATTATPVTAPITSVRTRNTWSSRFWRKAAQRATGALNHPAPGFAGSCAIATDSAFENISGSGLATIQRPACEKPLDLGLEFQAGLVVFEKCAEVIGDVEQANPLLVIE